MFFFLSKLLDVFLSPYTWGLLLVAAALPWRARSVRRWRRRRAFGLAGLAVLLLASSGPVSNGAEWSLEHASLSTYRPDVTYDAVILLGGAVEEEPSSLAEQASYNDNVDRLVMTERLLRENKARFAIVSGASSSEMELLAWSETLVITRQLVAWGIAPNRIIVENKARNTHENAVFTQAIAQARGFDRVLVVTSAFHMPRAAECFAAVGMKVDTLAVDFRAHQQHYGLSSWLPRAHNLAITSGTAREAFGRLVYRVQGYGKAVPE